MSFEEATRNELEMLDVKMAVLEAHAYREGHRQFFPADEFGSTAGCCMRRERHIQIFRDCMSSSGQTTLAVRHLRNFECRLENIQLN